MSIQPPSDRQPTKGIGEYFKPLLHALGRLWTWVKHFCPHHIEVPTPHVEERPPQPLTERDLSPMPPVSGPPGPAGQPSTASMLRGVRHALTTLSPTVEAELLHKPEEIAPRTISYSDYTVIPVPKIGNCLYESIGRTLGTDHATCRREVVEYLKSHKDDYLPFGMGSSIVDDVRTKSTYESLLLRKAEGVRTARGLPTMESQGVMRRTLVEEGRHLFDKELQQKLGHAPDDFDRFCALHATPQIWGTEELLPVIAACYHRQVLIFTGDDRSHPTTYGEPSALPPIVLNHVSGDHFQALRPPR